MRFRLHLAPVLASLSIVVALPTFSQVAPAATHSGLPLQVGAGFSNYNIDWGQGRREDGGTVYAYWTILRVPRILLGLGIGFEARDITFDAPVAISFMQYETAGGGAIYRYLRPRNIHPYAKAGEAFGRIKFQPGDYPGNYHSDTRNYFYMGGGGDFHAWRHVWIRADYEYQMWRDLFGSPNALTPNGFTIGPQYDFSALGER